MSRRKSSPDTTAKIQRTQIAEAAKAARPKRFVWPAPPYYEFIDPAAATAGEDCLITFRDEAKSNGTLLDFRPDESLLMFRPSDMDEGISIAFSSLLSVQLRAPVKLQTQALEIDDTAQLLAASEHQPFAIELASGRSLNGETVGSVHALCGLFLFPPTQNRAVTRWFVPAGAARRSEIGKPLGEMLIDEKLASSEAVDKALSRQQALRTRRFGEYLTENQIVSPEHLAQALKQQHGQPVQKLGEALVELGFLTEAQLQEALATEARDRSVPLGRILIDMGVIDAEVLNGVMARKLGIPFVSLKDFRIPPGVLKRIPAPLAHRFQVLPVSESDNALVVAVENPMDMARLEELRFAAGMKLLPVMASADDIRAALDRSYPQGRDSAVAATRRMKDVAIADLTQRLSFETAEADLDEDQGAEVDNTLVQLVNKMILDAIEQKASDIHIEANPGRDMRVRFRKDGVMVTYLDLAAKFRRAVVSRIKIMAQLDITERRKPQDGKIEDPFNFADALLGVLAQRLVRKLCPECKVSYTPSALELEELGEAAKSTAKVALFRAKGCARCDQIGYKGRIAVFELLSANAAVKRLVQTRAPVTEIAAAATANGLRTLRQDAIDKVIQGLTDLQQVRTV